MVVRLPVVAERPLVRADCELGGPLYIRPCPWVGCRHHAIGISATSRDLTLANGRDEPVAIPHRANERDVAAFIEKAATMIAEQQIESCTLDHAQRERGGTLENVAIVLGVTRERVRQIERAGQANLVGALRRRRVVDWDAKLSKLPPSKRITNHHWDPEDT